MTIGYFRYKVEKPRTSPRPFPVETAWLTIKKKEVCRKKNKCGDLNWTCKIISNGNYCATCKKNGHRTVASNCPLRPQTGQSVLTVKIYICNINNEKIAQILNNREKSLNNVQPGPQEMEISEQGTIQGLTSTLVKWMSTVLTLALPVLPFLSSTHSHSLGLRKDITTPLKNNTINWHTHLCRRRSFLQRNLKQTSINLKRIIYKSHNFQTVITKLYSKGSNK